MTTEQKINRANSLIFIALNLLDKEVYLKNRLRRNELAGYYKQFMNLESYFPQLSSNRAIPTKLEKLVSNSCPTCVSEPSMKIYINDAISFIKKYAQFLQDMVDGVSVEPIESVHDLKPRKKK